MKISIVVAGLMLCTQVIASGQFDPRFDLDGVRIVNAAAGPFLPDQFDAGLIDSRGRFVGAGRSMQGMPTFGSVVRVDNRGRLDTGFGNLGISLLETEPGYRATSWVDIVEQTDGKLVLAGWSSAVAIGPADPGRVRICRLMPDGSLDPSFGAAGCAQPQFWFDSTVEKVFGIALQDDGRIVMLGITLADNIAGFEWVVARLDTDGSFDTCFGDVTCQNGGVVIDAKDIAGFFPSAIALAPDGRIVVVGSANGTASDMAVVRLLPTGDLDVGFGNSGHRLIGFDLGGDNRDVGKSVAVASDGSIRVAGTADDDPFSFVGVAALDADGDLLASFGSGGRATVFFNDVTLFSVPTRVKVQDDGKTVVSGYTRDGGLGNTPPSDCGIARLRANGTLDPVFGFDGKLSIEIGMGVVEPTEDECLGMDLDGRSIVLFGSTSPTSGAPNNSLFVVLDQDDVFRDGFEAAD
jgi:uncharacterized delta-60 repeat protein